ncbi:putative Carbamoylphosphate synthase large subunit [Crenothrix polyspora]|uniref:Putative Carbamoylphosphate synthase large subunit n=1 Tax=Crenothrix polyspora TaxID=360316 RepID=A0A1R4GZY4_9GAMM|nr:ATP-grasp domain-containing protein [Crenothrix polyspora]SJM89514.1 putative Carbamoylphosphate synthase large subunit [Crenothrix polyspora]
MKNSKEKETFSVLIPDGESWLSYSVQSCLAQIPGVEVIVLSNNTLDPMRFSRHTRQFYSYDQNVDDGQAKLAAIYDTLKRTKVDVVLPIDTQTMRLLSEHKASVQALTAIAPIPDVEAIDIASNKWLLAKWLQEHQLPCPATLLYRADKKFEQALQTLSFPVLLKPTQQVGDVGIGGRGIHIFDHPAALIEFCKDNATVEYVVQPFINGYDIDCSVLCQDGKIEAYTIQKGFMGGRGRFDPPAGIDLLHDDQTYDVINALVAKMNWTGIAHFDLRYDEQDQQVKVIEINARFWGSLLGSLCAGVNFPYVACLAGLGRAIPKTSFRPLRYVNGGAAAKIRYQQCIGKKPAGVYFDHSALDFMMKDPWPKVVSYCFKAYSKAVSKLNGGTRGASLYESKNKI